VSMRGARLPPFIFCLTLLLYSPIFQVQWGKSNY
jgi:hypothetical protein